MVPLILALGCPSVGLAQPEPPPRDIDRLLQLDFAELIDTKVKLASRAEESAFATPAAVYVISAEDIRRSGHRRLAELLRLVPGLHVGKIDGDHWAVSSRNAQNRFSSTMLVMIDGRHIYTPLYGGVRWELQDTLLQDIDHIEVIRGPGGPLWGANAVDGIINIVTKHARDTHGTLLYAAAGDGEMNTDAGGRYGGVTDGGVNYRAYAKDYHSDNGAYLNADQSTHNGLRTPGEDAYDRENASQVGFRADWNANARDSLMLQANAYDNHIDEERSLSAGVFPNSADAQGVNSMLHWTRRLDSGNSLELNASLDQVRFSDDILNETQTLGDLDFQHLINRGPQQFIWGLGYRYYHNDVTIPDPTACDFTQPCFTLDPPKRTDNTLSAFVQDRVQTSAETAVIVGTKLEHNDYTDFEYQPTLRLLWTPTDDASLWTAVTRAVRTPTRTGSDGQLDFGSGVTVPIGNPDAEAWQVYAYEVGYRQRLSQRLNFDLAAFNDDYRNTLQPPLASPTSRGLDKVYGLEAVVRLQPLPRWRLETSYTLHR
ncbi:MAG: TonB-dependent receptor, partial [Gammaproteobacteria bacterium]|nr:TonB-dependent receptor [Gammaproteobacteria bacterium]